MSRHPHSNSDSAGSIASGANASTAEMPPSPAAVDVPFTEPRKGSQALVIEQLASNTSGSVAGATNSDFESEVAALESQWARDGIIMNATTFFVPNAAAEVVRAPASRLSQYGNHDVPVFAPIDVCFDLDKAAGDPVVLRALANLFGYDLTPRNLDAAVTADLAHAAGQVARESGELISAAIEASADGNLTPTEARRLDEDAADVEQKVVNLRNIVRPAMGNR